MVMIGWVCMLARATVAAGEKGEKQEEKKLRLGVVEPRSNEGLENACVSNWCRRQRQRNGWSEDHQSFGCKIINYFILHLINTLCNPIRLFSI